ncbi:MAG: serine/threonine-protein kinase [Pseudonocardiaceae bacterium]
MTADMRLIAGRYRLEQQIGAGAMGVVWRAHDVRLDRTVAVKQLLMQPGLSTAEAEAATARAMREGRIAARLQHPHAISVYDVALDDIDDSGPGGRPVPWLIMEYLRSHSLAAVLAEKGTLPPQEVAGIGRQVAAALAAAHRAGIVHRDVKPGNVLLGMEGIVKITDFGISRASWEAAVTATGVVAGTPAYFAPEVARGEPRDPAADVFSLGSTLYAAVEGEPPFGLDDNTLALLRTVAEGRVRPPQQAGPLSALLMRMLRHDPAQRPSMPEAVVALGSTVRGDTVLRIRPRPPLPPAPTAVGLPALPAQAGNAGMSPAQGGTGPQHPALNRRRRVVLAGAAACLLVLLGVLVLVLAAQRGGERQGADGTVVSSVTPGVTTTPPAAPPPGQPPEPAALEQTVRTYYSLLPGNPTAAWEFLGAPERAKAGGFDGYLDFWNGIDQVRIHSLSVQGNIVLVNLQFDPRDREPTFERYQLTMSTAGRVLIESSSVIGSFRPGSDERGGRGGRGNQAGDG